MEENPEEKGAAGANKEEKQEEVQSSPRKGAPGQRANSFGYPNTSTLTCCCRCDLDLSKRPVTLQDHRDC
ncbi:hypothetical protein EMCRGX_G011534 [Ephydatia muelleri]